MNITKVTSNESIKLDGEFNGEKYWIKVKGSSLTPAFRDALNKHATEPLILARELSERIDDWDLWLEKEGDLEPDFETISRFPDELVYSLVETYGQAWSGDKKKQSASASG